MENKKISYQDKNIFYRSGGKGKAVVLLHGFGEDGSIWDNVTELEKNFHLIIPDLPGSGNSEMLTGENISIDNYADLIKEIITKEFLKVSPVGQVPIAIGIEGAVIIGHSMGGYIALAFAEKYPNLLNGLGIFHSSALADDDEKIKTRHKAIEFIQTNGAEAFLKTSIPNLFGEKFKKEHADQIDVMIKKGESFTPSALIQYYNAMINRPDRTEVLKTFRHPVLFIAGEEDNAVPLQAVLQQCHLPATSYLTILPAAGHMGMLEEKDKCREALQTFLQNI